MQISSRSVASRITSPNRPNQGPSVAVESDRLEAGTTAQDFVPPKLADMLQKAGRPYYDEPRDNMAKEAYYRDIDQSASPTELFQSFSSLVSKTHREQLSFKPRKYLHPWVDLRPNLRLQSIYSSQPVATGDEIHVTKSRDFVQRWKTKVRGHERADGTHGPDRLQNKKIDFRAES
ncbi:MAG: hypothetical protein KC800_20855, partial [Candidatus Eremiobacteraeota bacterium]|nr:hypothetical protein [Candidatus Eremiobacteraeota bacterium]